MSKQTPVDQPLPKDAQRRIMNARLGPVLPEAIKLPVPSPFPLFDAPTPSEITAARLDYKAPSQTKK